MDILPFGFKSRIPARAIALVCSLALANSAIAADPVINVAWDESPAPLANVDFVISTSSPASPAFPNVDLVTGSLTWKIWSTDTDNTDNLGDIGEIRCPYAQNFAVKIRNDSHPFLTGARNVKAIRLVPSSTNNYANITEAYFGGLSDELIVAPNSSGTGGEVWLSMVGSSTITADMTIHKAYKFLGGVFSGTVTIGELVGEFDTTTISGDISITKATAETEQHAAGMRILGDISGSLTIEEIATEQFFPFLSPGHHGNRSLDLWRLYCRKRTGIRGFFNRNWHISHCHRSCGYDRVSWRSSMARLDL